MSRRVRSRQDYGVKGRGDAMNRRGSEADTGSDPALSTHQLGGLAQPPQLLSCGSIGQDRCTYLGGWVTMIHEDVANCLGYY